MFAGVVRRAWVVKSQRSAGRVVGVYPKGSEERQARRTWKPPSSSLPCPLHALSQAEQRRAFTAEKPQRRRTLIRVKQAIESWLKETFFIPL
ncbi:hypothetical protein CgunFtcFv8_011943 [Champsocephalus gunnari]|uniref:Uncharacterized protein n=1 Tax=Champsocephalus gunnari TaxID=52237 RepID=A0AAN8HIW6_CHAGU|nr:hypothetical protein CgunFtcFv8_011943 [Champsocephalus gunnari]